MVSETVADIYVGSCMCLWQIIKTFSDSKMCRQTQDFIRPYVSNYYLEKKNIYQFNATGTKKNLKKIFVDFNRLFLGHNYFNSKLVIFNFKFNLYNCTLTNSYRCNDRGCMRSLSEIIFHDFFTVRRVMSSISWDSRVQKVSTYDSQKQWQKSFEFCFDKVTKKIKDFCKIKAKWIFNVSQIYETLINFNGQHFSTTKISNGIFF